MTMKKKSIFIDFYISFLTKRLSLTARIVFANEYEHISVPFLKWQTFNFRGA